MPNRTSIEIFQRRNLMTQKVDYTIDMYDDHDYVALILDGDIVHPQDLLQAIERLIRETHREDIHGGDAEKVRDMLDRLVEDERGVYFGSNTYPYSMIKDTLSQDLREVYFCPKCGWESFDDVNYEADCGQSGCDGKMTETRDEWYDK